MNTPEHNPTFDANESIEDVIITKYMDDVLEEETSKNVHLFCKKHSIKEGCKQNFINMCQHKMQ